MARLHRVLAWIYGGTAVAAIVVQIVVSLHLTGFPEARMPRMYLYATTVTLPPVVAVACWHAAAWLKGRDSVTESLYSVILPAVLSVGICFALWYAAGWSVSLADDGSSGFRTLWLATVFHFLRSVSSVLFGVTCWHACATRVPGSRALP